MTSKIAEYYDKSIRIAPDGFSFYKIKNGKVEKKHFQDNSGTLFSEEVKSFFEENDEITVISSTATPALIPEEIFDSHKIFDYLKLHTDISKFGKAYQDSIENYISLYFLTQEKQNSVEKLENKLKFAHETSIFHKFLQENAEGNDIFISKDENFFDIMIVKNRQLQLVNRFNLATAEDVLYYCANLIKQFRLREPKVFLLFHTSIDKKIPDFLNKYKIDTQILEI